MSETTVYRDGDASCWENYLKGRPKYSQNFFDTIFAYHESHGGDWGVSHDVGTGAGQAASLFAPKFKTVIGSDMEESQIRVAAARLAHVQNLEFVHSQAERLSDRFPGHSADLVAVSEALPLMDVREVLESAAALLKPGGPFAAWYYGRPLFVCDASEDLDARCNDAYSNLVDAIYRDIVPHVLKFVSKAKLQVLMEHQASGLADVELPKELFENVHRHTWNHDIGSMSFVSSLPAIGLDDNWTSRIGKNEQCTQEIDREFWSEQWNTDDIKVYLATGAPWYTINFEAYRDLIEELEVAIGGVGARKRVTWPAVLILATAK